MRKTIVTVAVACMLMVTSTNAENRTDGTDVTVKTTILKNVEINSFCMAIVKGDFETVKSLIALGEDVNQKSMGKTPAIYAARFNKAEILQLLIDNGADLNIKCNKGYTAKKYAKLSNAKDALAVIEAALN